MRRVALTRYGYRDGCRTKKRERRDREFDVEKGIPRRMIARMDISEWNMYRRGNEGVDIRKIKEGGRDDRDGQGTGQSEAALPSMPPDEKTL